MKKVLIAIDYHPVSEQVAHAGYELANKLDAEICLIHVLADVAYYGTQFPTFMGYDGYTNLGPDLDMALEMRNVAKEFLQKAAEHLNDPKVTTHLAEGETADVLLEYAGEWGADMIVMGTHSHSKLEKLLMGTVAQKVLEKTTIPVYMVPVKK
ncbi:universal stress protein [Salinimicrobium flavum]|uniref:Universal stress protein n=1 Tax=Salinimicrobium flavum TaxID=1737065 RepID=A0ABW5IYN2_9FLAO